MTLKLWILDLEWEARAPVDWDESARPFLQTFLTLHPPARSWFRSRKPPTWTAPDFQELLRQLQWAGYGWLRPDGVQAELERMAATWQGPPPLPPAKV